MSFPILSAYNLSVQVAGGRKILADAHASFAEGKLHALVGPSGCGKTTLMKAVLGMIEAQGTVFWHGEALPSSDALTGRVGWIPQFSIAYADLTVWESLVYCVKLFVAEGAGQERVQECLSLVGLWEHREKLVKNLSGGQMRRLGLALELVTDPEVLICDEVTSGLDPNSEEEILQLLRRHCDEQGKTIICIIHNLAKLSQFDSVTVVRAGRVIFQGTYPTLQATFSLRDPLLLYNQLELCSVEERVAKDVDISSSQAVGSIAPRPQPSVFVQTITLLRRRFRLFFRDRSQLFLTLAITVGFPLVVVLFAWDGLPQLEWLKTGSGGDVIAEMKEGMRFQKESARTASLVTGLIMFQVVLLTLMASNTGAREIAGTRNIWEKERLNGLSIFSYIISKLLFTASIAAVQGVWMTVFVKWICQFPGEWSTQIAMLVACTLGMTWICLGFSALAKTPEKASLLSIYLVGFQLPLSGIFLALPDFLSVMIRPFINAYWSWSGYMASMKDNRLYDAFRLQNESAIPDVTQSLFLLCLHMIIGITLIAWGTSQRQEI